MDYEFYYAFPNEIPYELAAQLIASEDYDLLNECGRFAPTVSELFERMRGAIPLTKSDEWLIKACKRWLKQSAELHARRKEALGLLP